MIDIESLKLEVVTEGKNPRVHPNSFIQLDLAPVGEGDAWDLETRDESERPTRGHSGASKRLHIWNPPGVELPHQETVNEIHDHVFDMKSTIVFGQLWQLLYRFKGVVDGIDEPMPTHQLYKAVYDKNSSSRLEATGQLGIPEMYSRFPVSAGQAYDQPAFTFHDTETPMGMVITVMEKTKIHDGDAHVLCPLDTEPDNDFDRRTAMPEDELWAIIGECLERVS